MLVYPKYEEAIVEPFEIPNHWEKMQGSDFGINDPTVALWGAIDPRDGSVYIYDEHYENNQPVNYHAKKMKSRLDQIPFGRLRFVVGDPSGTARRDADLRSTFDHYAEYGVYFQPGNNRLEAGIFKVHTFFEIGKIKIFKTCKKLIKELQNYRYPPKVEDGKKNNGDIPLDKDNHACDSLRYMIVELPDDPNDLIMEHVGNYVFGAHRAKREENLPLALQDDPTEYEGYKDEWYYTY